MVLYKRKPVSIKESTQKLSDTQEIWVMPRSNEIFTDYESYLKRYDFLSQKKFTDAVNGKSGMTFFAALESETSSSSGIEKIFPDALRDPILRKVQFSDIPRIDELVTYVFEEFRNDFFPGEEVSVILDEGEQLEGIIREKAKFPELRGVDGSLQRAAFSRYFVRLRDQAGDEALLDDSHIKRGRHVFTKQNLRAFLKNSLQRESWTGAPWLVKEHLAIQYRLPMEIPAHLQQGARALEHRVSKAEQRFSAFADAAQPQPLQPAQHFNSVKGRKGKNLTPQDFSMERLALQQSQVASPGGINGSHHEHTPSAPRQEVTRVNAPVKYPIDDLDILPKRNGNTRPRLKFIAPLDGTPSTEDGLQMKSVGPLLEVWNTLNVQCEVYVLDSFTFDDFVDAMKFSSPEISCELFEEVHCAVLKQLVDEEGAVQVRLPDMVEDEASEEEEEVAEESEPATPVEAPAHGTRSRLSQMTNASDTRDDTPADHKHRPHRAAEMLAEYGWVDRLKARDFANGGWQAVMVGLLYQLSLDVRQKAVCESVLSQLAPLDEEPTQEVARQRYSTLDVNLKIAALEIITLLSLSTKALRNYLETCSEDMTSTRKSKLEHQKVRKEAIHELGRLEQEKRTTNPDAFVTSPKEESEHPVLEELNGDVDDTLGTNGSRSSDAEDDEPSSSRSLRRGNDRANERKRKRDEESARKEKERLEKLEASKASTKQLKEYKRILKEMEVLRTKIREREEEIATCDRDLREANCQRTKVLGRDRFWNRYYWFERNGMPFGGMPDSSTAEYGYANGRIWVQGPDDMERIGFIDLSREESDMYSALHKVTVPERKTMEEGSTILNKATEWGYYDDADSIDALLGWLDDRGRREKEFRKELTIWREDVVAQMDKLKEHLELEKTKKEENAEEPVARVSTRHKTYVDKDALGQRCLKWHNTTAVEALGYVHSEPPRLKEKKGKAAREGKGVAIKVVPPKPTKPVTRHATRSGR